MNTISTERPVCKCGKVAILGKMCADCYLKIVDPLNEEEDINEHEDSRINWNEYWK